MKTLIRLIHMMLCVAAAAGGDALAQEIALGRFVKQVEQLREPNGVAIGRSGMIYVAEAAADRVSIISTRGRRVGFVAADAGLRAPHGVALDADERLYIADTGNHRIVVLNRAGAVEATWCSHGDGPGQLKAPRALAVGRERVWVADTGNDRVQVFDLAGRHVVTYGERGSRVGAFRRPSGLALADDGTAYIADTGNHRFQRIDPDGSIRAYGEWGAFPGLVAEPAGLAWNPSDGGALFIADGLNHRVHVMNRVGDYLGEWGLHATSPHDGEGRLHYPVDVDISADGTIAVVCEPIEDRIQIFGVLDGSGGPSGPVVKDNTSDFGTHMAVAGSLLVVNEPESRSVAVFDLRSTVPILITNFGEPGASAGLIGSISGLAIGGERNRVAIADGDNARVAIHEVGFDAESGPRYDPFRTRFVRSRGERTMPQTDTEPPRVGPLTRDATGAIWMLDQDDGRVHRLDEDLRVTASWGGPDALARPAAIVVSADGSTVLVSDPWRSRVVAFDRDGNERFVIEDAGGTRLIRPHGVTTTRNGSIFVTDASLDRIVRYDALGNYVDHFGEHGADFEQFWKPTAIAEGPSGKIFVLDHGNHRIQAFDPDGTWQLSFGLGRAWTPRNRPKSTIEKGED